MKITRTVLYTMAALFLAGWVLGCFFLQTGPLIHVFIMVAAIFCMRAIIINPKPEPQG